MSKHIALNPERSVAVEACAGSGKTWMLVSRIVRLLLDGALPSQILAITFTRKAAQEMQARLQLWLRDLAMSDESTVRDFFAERGLEKLSEAQLLRVRSLYSNVILAQPGITISTFHGWFMQVIQRAPLNADVMHGMTLLEHAASTQEEAWEEMLEEMRKQPDSAEAHYMKWLFAEYGLFTTREMLFNFIGKRAEWWAYTQGQQDTLAFSLDILRSDLAVEMTLNPVTDWGISINSAEVLFAFVQQLAANGTDVQIAKASSLEQAWNESEPGLRFNNVSRLLFTKENNFDGRIKPTKKQDAALFERTRDALAESLLNVCDKRTEQNANRLNEAVLHCGVVFLNRYQAIKAQSQQMDFSDLEWQLCRLLQQSEHAETMQYKLDCRYKHVLLDEFQDTNPLQWQILRAWFDAAVAVESQPTVFVVGDPKQSIYRFRRADARLFGVMREYLKENFAAHELYNNHSRRNSPAVLTAVNAVFADHPDGFVDFEPHTAEHKDLPGYVSVLPLAIAEEITLTEVLADTELHLRNPLTTARAEAETGARQNEAIQVAALLKTIASDWSIHEGSKPRRATYGDIMVLVRSRTHLAVYESALRAQNIPFISSRRGGLLDTLEAEDLQALLLFLITPFADLALAQVLRSPVFACSDEDLIFLARNTRINFVENGVKISWWQCLKLNLNSSPALQRATDILQNWLEFADKLPVHDLLDRIYFEGDVLARYSAVLPSEKRTTVNANLHAFMEIALSVDAGRYPSLPRFLQELKELRDSKEDAPDEGKLGSQGNAVRIYTVHESKGLEAPIVWLLDANSENKNKESNDVLLDWPTNAERPLHFSLYTDQSSRGKKRALLFEQEAAQKAREEMNLLYVAMTRAQQALIVSGHSIGEEKEENKKTLSWYDRISAVTTEQLNPLVGNSCTDKTGQSTKPSAEQESEGAGKIVVLPPRNPAGKRTSRNSVQQQRGIWLHAILQCLSEEQNIDERELQQRLLIPLTEFDSLFRQAKNLLSLPQFERFYDDKYYHAACNEMSYINASGELKRIDRLVEFEDEVWVLDYKLGEQENAELYRAQMKEYRSAMQSVFASKKVRSALLFANGDFVEMI